MSTSLEGFTASGIHLKLVTLPIWHATVVMGDTVYIGTIKIGSKGAA